MKSHPKTAIAVKKQRVQYSRIN